MGPIHRRTLLAIAAAGAALALSACGNKADVSGADMSLGDANAKVTVIEYGSLSCHHCADWNAEVFEEFKKKYIDTGKVRYVFRPFMLGNSDTYTAAGDLLGRCAGKDQYFRIIDSLFRSQQDALSGDARGALMRVGASAGMGEDKVNACILDTAQVEAQAKRFGDDPLAKQVEATPTFFINGEKYGEKLLMPAMDKAIAKAEAAAK